MMQRIILIALPFVVSACFVSTSDCVQRGVVVEPCAITARAGQTIVLNAEIPGAPSEPVDWILPASVGTAFAVSAEPNRLTLIGLQNVPGNFPIQASSQTEASKFGGSVVGVSSATYSSQAPPFVIFGGDLPVGSKFSAIAAGGNLYYVAYAGVGAFAPPENNLVGPSLNFFVQQFSLATNQLLRDVSGQFSTFVGTGTVTPIVPNIAADCAGNGYWVDFVTTGVAGYVLRRLRANGAGPDEQPLGQFDSFNFQTLSVACDGAIYFVADPQGGQAQPILFRIVAFGGAAVPVTTTPVDQPFFIDTMAADPQGRLLIGNVAAASIPGLQRLIVDPDAPGGPETSVDPVFNVTDPDAGVFDVSTDALGVVYAAMTGAASPVISALNELGTVVYEIGTYEYFCPSSCTLITCGTQIPFTSILSVAATPGGALRIVDDPDTGNLPPGCREALRYVLIDPQ